VTHSSREADRLADVRLKISDDRVITL
jgi:hypothetical protein